MARVDYKFYLGQRVEYHPPQDTDIPRGAYVVIAKLPKQDDKFQYRIRHMNEQHQCIAREDELRALGGEK
ncbi:MAG: hypothetical protein JOZ29_21240 [Deltaproteobacteria bacterium]|nr:hypothetical protein [Deltaproteobacteria bacterium]